MFNPTPPAALLLLVGPDPVAVLVPEDEDNDKGEDELDGVLMIAVFAASWKAETVCPDESGFTANTIPELQS
jgi:hypothetical protein